MCVCAVSACEPPLGGAAALLAQLNAAPRAGLPRFLAGMRAGFKALVAARAGAPAQLCA